jgi:hypothetical protein
MYDELKMVVGEERLDVWQRIVLWQGHSVIMAAVDFAADHWRTYLPHCGRGAYTSSRMPEGNAVLVMRRSVRGRARPMNSGTP